MEDPFFSGPSDAHSAAREFHRYSSFDNKLFSLNASSPSHVKRALEAHLAETERRLEEASKLGTTLIQQQKELSDKLVEVDRQQQEGEITPDLRQRLLDLEREYNEIGRETARAFLAPKRMVSGGDEGHMGTPSFDQKSPISPALLTSQATGSPTKVSVPSRKKRNQPSSRVHDIEFATEISTSLLAQVRQLQALLAEREEALKTANVEKSRLELEAEGYCQRIRALDESEQRYKDENWSLETQTRELTAAVKEATDRETRLNSSISAVTAEKNALERDLEEVKQANSKLLEEQASVQKANDAEIHVLRRNLNAADAEKLALQEKLAELNFQNQELAKAVAHRVRHHESEVTRDISPDNDDNPLDQETPENSPPPSPNKFTPRHNHLETETLKSSLGHAHRMIQNLRGTIHREKTEKIELKRMLQEARDELEQRRREAAAPGQVSNKRQKIKRDSFKKPPRPDLLGSGRKGKTEVEMNDADWEETAGDRSPLQVAKSDPSVKRLSERSDYPSEVYQTATEADDAFETANEHDETTESEAFQTGVESMADDSDVDDLTETEDTLQRTSLHSVPSATTLAKQRTRPSVLSTAISEDDDDVLTSPTEGPHYRLKTKRSVLRRIRPSGEAPMASNSRPSSARDSPAASFIHTDAQVTEGQSLFAELAELEGGENEDEEYVMTARSDPPWSPRTIPPYDSRRPSQATIASVRMRIMVDASVMTDLQGPATPVDNRFRGTESATDLFATPVRAVTHSPDGMHGTPKLINSGAQWTPLRSPGEEQFVSVPTPPKMAWDDRAPDTEQMLANSAVQPPQLNLSDIFSQHTAPTAPTRPSLTTSYVVGEGTEPIECLFPAPVLPDLAVSPIFMQQTEPVRFNPLQLSLSSVFSHHTVPVLAKMSESQTAYVPELSMSSVQSKHTPPDVPQLPQYEPLQLAVSSVSSQCTEPSCGNVVGDVPPPSRLVLSTICSEHTVPVVPESPRTEFKSTAEKAVATDDVPQLAISLLDPVYTRPISRQLDPPVHVTPRLSFSPLCAVETRPVDFVLPGSPITSAGVDSDPKPTNESCIASQPPDGSAGNRSDHEAQTVLLSKQIDQLFIDRLNTRPLSPPDSGEAKELGTSPLATPKGNDGEVQQTHASPVQSVSRRPSSSASQASSVLIHPPLPPDHREVITAAEKRSVDKISSTSAVMGPPLAPASAYRANATTRPRTPKDRVGQAGSMKNSSVHTQMRRGSQVSRRSSVSSFASELEERFNITSTPSVPHSDGLGTDPRMILAITQTMIGEFLWKYTRKTVTGDISNTRHRRYFWVHPYTRTLYWSDKDPQTAGKNQVKTKSVPIEAVRVISDDNIYPPGLHRKSLEVISPGRKVRFTATTSQRHETWFNALSYLLVRDSDETSDDHENDLTLEDIEEFNPRSRSASRQTTRLSVSSYNSRKSPNLVKPRAASAMSIRPAITTGRVSPALSAPNRSNLQVPDGTRQSSSRISTIFNSTIRGSFSSLKSRTSPAEIGLQDASVHEPDSPEAIHPSKEKQRERERLENVRACCDGQHDVGSLPRISRYSPKINRTRPH